MQYYRENQSALEGDLRGVRTIPRYNSPMAYLRGRGPFSQIDQYPQGGDRRWSEFGKRGISSPGENGGNTTWLLGGLYFPNGGLRTYRVIAKTHVLNFF